MESDDDSSSSMDEDQSPEVKVKEEILAEDLVQEEKPKILLQPEEQEADDLGLDKSQTKVWLVKIPKFVSEKWSNITETGVELGKIRIYKKQVKDHRRRDQGVPLVKLVLPDIDIQEDDELPPIPKNYNLTITNMAPKNEYVFTESSQGKAVEVAGTVHHEATVGPVIDDDYRRIMKLRTKSSEQASTSRAVQMLSDKSSKKGVLATSGNQWDLSKTHSKKTIVDKRERLPKDELLNAIFVLFQTNQFFTLKELIDKTQQPQIWLKEVLNEVCDFHKRGPNVQKYELKAEYKSNNAIIGHEVSGQGSEIDTMVELKIKYKGPAPDGSRASLVGNPKDFIGMVSMPLSTRLKLVQKNGFDLYAAQVSIMNAKGGKDIMDPPWLAKDALEMDTIPLSKKEVSSDEFLEFFSTFQGEIQDLLPEGVELPVTEPVPHPEFSFIKVKKSLSNDVLDVLLTDSSPLHLSEEESSRKRSRLIPKEEIEINSSASTKKYKADKDADMNGRSESAAKPPLKSSQKAAESKKTFALTSNNGKNVSSNTWAEIGTRLKHKADDNRKDKEKRVTTYTNAIYYCASLLAYWTWCNHQEHQKNYEKVKVMAKFALESIIHHKLDLLHCFLNYAEAHIVSKIVNGLHKELQTTLSIISSLAKDMDKHDKEQISSLQDTISKSQKMQADIWKKTNLISALLKEAHKLSPETVNPFYEYATSTDAFAFIRQCLIDLARDEDIDISFASASQSIPNDIRF